MYILKISYINDRVCVHYGLFPHFKDLTGLVSVRTSLNFIVMYTLNTAEILPNWDLKGLLIFFKFTQNVRLLTFFVCVFSKAVPLGNHGLHVLL